MSRPRIVVVGSANTDLVVRAGTIPKAGETVLGTSFFMVQGGKGANQAVAAARLGADVTFVARVGTDSFGSQAIEAYQREGISTDFVVRDENATTGIALIVVDDAGENAIAVAPGANHRLRPSDVERANERIAAADVVLLQLEIPLDTVRDAVQLAARAGVPVILNPAPAQRLGKDLLAAVTVLTPNAQEAEALAGIAPGTAVSPSDTAHALRGLGANNVVITLGAEGALLTSDQAEDHVSAAPVRAIDTTGAGDAFNGALAYALASGETLPTAVRVANLAGALAATRPGAQPSLPTTEQLEAFAATLETPAT